MARRPETLERAARDDDAEAIAALVAHGAEIEARDALRYSALHVAALLGCSATW